MIDMTKVLNVGKRIAPAVLCGIAAIITAKLDNEEIASRVAKEVAEKLKKD